VRSPTAYSHTNTPDSRSLSGIIERTPYLTGNRQADPALARAPDAHHNRVRFTWHLKPLGGDETVAVGIDFGVVAEDGRLRSVTGFLEPVDQSQASAR
jgi:hypothetical protein